MNLPSLPLIVLRLVATLELSAVVGQAGWAAAGLGGQERYFATHGIGAGVTLAVCLVGACLYLVLRRRGGPVNTTLAVLVALAVAAQYALGEAHRLDLHIFLGVLIVILVTALTSWTYRHPDTSGGPAAGESQDSTTLRDKGAHVA